MLCTLKEANKERPPPIKECLMSLATSYMILAIIGNIDSASSPSPSDSVSSCSSGYSGLSRASTWISSAGLKVYILKKEREFLRLTSYMW